MKLIDLEIIPKRKKEQTLYPSTYFDIGLSFVIVENNSMIKL
jgi:hypothetical protein